jgi:hypothetical protein
MTWVSSSGGADTQRLGASEPNAFSKSFIKLLLPLTFSERSYHKHKS